MSTVPWYRCPNEPPCGHARVFHDIYDDTDEVPRCCEQGCGCGDRLADGPLTREEYAALVAAGLSGP
jgi:hypothetical protein